VAPNAGSDRQAWYPNLVIIGANSRGAQAIRRAWPGSSVTLIHRGEGPGIAVSDYASVPEGAVQPGSVVVNCVGTPLGTEAELMRVNHEVPLRWCEAAMAAGASHFIQLSSFAIYGKARLIDGRTPEKPMSSYGKSKLAADRALLEFDRRGLPVTLLRIPMLFGDGSDKMAQLIGMVLRAGFVPALDQQIERSMLSYDALGAVVAIIATSPQRGVANIADPTPFTYELLQDCILRATGRRIRKVWMPGLATAAIRLAAPALHARILASSKLDPAAALMVKIPAAATIKETIKRMAKPSRPPTDP
jgi:nucleoside-diphosphate-sugar epimerase